VGQRDAPGRPNLYGTTQEFLEYFNLESLSELPPLLERRETSEIARELNLRLPLEGQGEGAGPATDGETEAAQTGQGEGQAEQAGPEAPAGADEASPHGRRTAQVIPFDDALSSKDSDSDGEAS